MIISHTSSQQTQASPLFEFHTAIHTVQGRIQKIQKEGAEFPTLPEWNLHFSGDAVYMIVGVFVKVK